MAERIPNSTVNLLIDGKKLAIFPLEVHETLRNLNLNPYAIQYILSESNEINRSFGGLVDVDGNFREFTEEEKIEFANNRSM